MMKLSKLLTNLFNSDPTFVGAADTTLIKGLTTSREKYRSIFNILVAEDNLTDQNIIVAQLRKLGFEVHPVVNGHEAIAALSSFDYDLILMDCQMPMLNGYQTTKAIRRGEAGIWGSKTPVIAITGTKENFKKCIVADMDDCLLKPLDLNLLDGCIRRFLVNEKDPSLLDQQNAHDHRDKYMGISPNISRIDRTALDKLQILQQEGAPDILFELIEGYIATSSKLLSGMKEALKNQDMSLLAQGAHSLKSSSASLGATWVATIAQGLEMVNGLDSWDEATKLLERLEIELQFAKTELESILKSRTKTP
jgi:two-component system sensor histidine kinase/response regulator